MSVFKASILLLAAFAEFSNAHGYLQQAIADGQTNVGPKPWEQYNKLPNTALRIGYSSDSSGTYCLFASDFNNANKMSCGPSSNNPAPGTVKVQAGSSVDLYWAGSTGELKGYSNAPNGFFPFVHAMGPVIDYLASCEGDCSKFDATDAKWTKMAEFGVDDSQTISQELRGLMAAKPEVYHPTSGAGLWGMSKMIEDGSKWTLDIPEDLAPGQYLWRNEISAVHSNPAQIYVGCVQLEVTGSGSTNLPAGVTSDQFYTKDSILGNFNTYTYDYSKAITLPGPAVWDGASGSSNTTTTTTRTAKPAVTSDALDEGDINSSLVTPTPPKTVGSAYQTGASRNSNKACLRKRFAKRRL